MYEEYLSLAKEARERAEKATKGPWKVNSNVDGSPEDYEVWDEYKGYGPVAACIETAHDAKFIAAARQDVPALADVVERLVKDVEQEQVNRTLVEKSGRVYAERDALRAQLQVATEALTHANEHHECNGTRGFKDWCAGCHCERALEAIKQPE